MNYGRELLKGSTDSLLLCLINGQAMYGYQIIKELERNPALHRLEKNGLVKGKWHRLLGGQERRYYHITEKGQEALNARLAMWRGFSEAVNLIMLPTV
jgi:PadR family transcriptional regulator PadR